MLRSITLNRSNLLGKNLTRSGRVGSTNALTLQLSRNKGTVERSQVNKNNNIFEKFPTVQNSLYNKNLEKDNCGVGLVAQMKKIASRQIVVDANQMLVRMSHRGGCGCEVNAGDGAGTSELSPHPCSSLMPPWRLLSYASFSLQLSPGILVGMPDSYYRRVVKEAMGKTLPPLNEYGAGIVFTPKGDVAVNAIKEMFEVRQLTCY